MRKYVMRTAMATLALLAVLGPAQGAEGRIPIWFPNPATPVNYVIGVPGGEGNYILTRNIDASVAGGPAIIVTGLCGLGNEGAVEIDLNGFTIFADPAGGPVIDVDCLESVVIRNGSIEPPPGVPSLPFGFGVDVFDVDKVVIEDLKIRGTGDTGMTLMNTGRSFSIRRNLIRDINFPAIYVDTGGGVGGTGLIEENVITDSGGGIDVINPAPGGGAVSALTIRGNAVETTFDPGFGTGIRLFNAHSFLIIENTIEETFLDGIRLEQCSSGKVVNNTVQHAGNGGFTPLIHGISLFGGVANLFLDNVSAENGQTSGVAADGLYIDGQRNVIRGNLLNDNVGFGLHFAPNGIPGDNTYGDNTGRGNFGAAPCAHVAPVDGFCLTPGGSFPPGLCNEEPFPTNTSFCTNLMPGPPAS